MTPDNLQPGQIPTDDSHSLEGADTIVEQGQSPIANSQGSPIDGVHPSPDQMPGAPINTPKGNFFSRIWRKFNIYMLLFLLVLLVASGVVIVMTVKGKQAANNPNTLSSQSLTDNALKQLANSEATVGNQSQVLNIESNSIFAGSVLIKKDLELAGNLKISGALALPGITVSGTSTFNQVQAQTLDLSGAATVNGILTAKNGLSVNGNGSFTGSLSAAQVTTGSFQLNGDLLLTHHITGGGPIPGVAQGLALGSGGTASVSGSDTSGSIAINTGSSPAAGCFETITFARAYSSTPHVIVTPIGTGAAGLAFYVNRSTTSFSVCTTSPAPAGQSFGFDYMIMD